VRQHFIQVDYHEPMTATPRYTELTRVYARLYRYQHLGAIVGWDRNAMMPPKGNDARAAAEAELYALIHRTRTDPQLKAWLDAAENEPLDDLARANLREIRRDWRDANALPESLIEAKTLAGARCEHAWRSQRPVNDWKGFLENFREVVKLARQEAQLLADDTGLSRYDALMDRFEPGVRAADIDRIFGDVRRWLPGLIKLAQEKQNKEKVTTPIGPFPVVAQRALNQEVMTLLGFDFSAGRLDESTHPFSGGVPKHEDTEQTIAELKARITKTVAFIESVPQTPIDSSADRDITLKLGKHDYTFKGMDYLLKFAQPIFIFMSPRPTTSCVTTASN